MKTQKNSSGRRLLLAAALALWTITVGCSSAPAPAESDDATAEAGQAEVAERNQEIEELRAEVKRLEAELSSLEEATAEAARDDADTRRTRQEGTGGQDSPGEAAGASTENANQLRRENERLRDLVEELRLAMTAVGVQAQGIDDNPVPLREKQVEQGRTEEGERPAPVDLSDERDQPSPEPESGQTPSTPEPTERRRAEVNPSVRERPFVQVESVNPPVNDQTPPQLREQRILRIPTAGGGYVYVDERANSSDGEGLYLELYLLPDMQVPEVRLRATAVYPVETDPLRSSGFTLAEGEELFEFRIADIERRRSGSLAAETLTAAMQPELRRLLVFLQRRPMAELLLTFHGTAGERSHRVTRNELLALGNMIYTMREMGADL